MTVQPTVTQHDLDSLATKLSAFSETLPPAELALLTAILQRAAVEPDDVQGHGGPPIFKSDGKFDGPPIFKTDGVPQGIGVLVSGIGASFVTLPS